MPAMYERIRDKLIAEGKGEDEAQAQAAKIYNAWATKHGKPHLSPKSEVREKRGFKSKPSG